MIRLDLDKLNSFPSGQINLHTAVQQECEFVNMNDMH